MTAPTEKTLNVGLRYACVFELDANSYPKASGDIAGKNCYQRQNYACEERIERK